MARPRGAIDSTAVVPSLDRQNGAISTTENLACARERRIPSIVVLADFGDVDRK